MIKCGRGNKALSIIPVEIVEFFIKYYCPKNGLYFDPFAGQFVRGQVAKLYNIDYIGYDVSKFFSIE